MYEVPFQRPIHGGGLNEARKKYCIEKPFEQFPWLDLSTGINPNGWPVPLIPSRIYNRLPEKDDGLIEIAKSYYQAEHILPVSGSQEAIQLLPFIFRQYDLLPEHSRIGIISPCYKEHEFQWKKNNFSIVHLTSEAVDNVIHTLDVLVLINPNNPTGELISTKKIKSWHAQLSQRQGFLIIDEAFMDSTPEHSIINKCSDNNLIVLRSIGKFFGLAGVRCGFVIAPPKILSLLEYHQGPWSVSGPTRWIIKQVLQDNHWIEANKIDLNIAAKKLEQLLTKYLINNDKQYFLSGTVLFKTVFTNNAETLFELLAKKGILVRLLDESCLCPSCTTQLKTIQTEHKGLRFGLPANETQFQHLEAALFKLKSDQFV